MTHENGQGVSDEQLAFARRNFVASSLGELIGTTAGVTLELLPAGAETKIAGAAMLLAAGYALKDVINSARFYFDIRKEHKEQHSIVVEQHFGRTE